MVPSWYLITFRAFPYPQVCTRDNRKIGELELDFENPTWNSNWDFEEFTVKFTVDFTVRFTSNIIINNLKQKTE